jgi:hypothetical protein
MPNKVLLDTSFFIRFLTPTDPLFSNADGYFKYFLQNNIPMVISTICIGEYCVKGSHDELPLLNLQMLPYNFEHAKRTGEFARIVFDHRGQMSFVNRLIIPNDTKIFAQADTESDIDAFLSADGESLKIYELIKRYSSPQFKFIDLNTPHHETYGILGL